MAVGSKLRAIACVMLGASAGPSLTHAAETHADWHYQGREGPAAWATLSPEYAECGTGMRQSPIDLPVAAGPGIAPAPAVEMRVFHHPHALDIANNGHTVTVAYDDGDQLVLAGQTYTLVQYHFHAPSEHTFGGVHFPLELHLVHRAGSGALAVVGVMLEHGATSAAYDTVISGLPAQPGAATHFDRVAVDIDALLPAARDAFAYTGSLTTPPCTEGVRWLVLRTPVALDTRQVETLARVLDHNNRPVQALHGRRLDATHLDATIDPAAR